MKELKQAIIEHLVSALLVLGAYAGRILLTPLLGQHAPYITFFPAVLFAAFFGGFWPGVTATGLSVLLASIFSSMPGGVPFTSDNGMIASLIIFTVNGIAISGLCEIMRRRMRQAEHLKIELAMRKDAEVAAEAIRSSEERFRLATSAGAVGVWEWDIAANHVSWSDSIYEIHGVEKNEFGHTVEAFASLVHPDDLGRVNQTIERSLQHGAPYELEFRSLKPDGTIIWIYTKAKVIRNHSGQAVRLLGATVDITRRRQAEVALSEAALSLTRERERLSIALRAGQLGVYEWKVGEHSVWWSPETFPVYGVSPETFIPTVETFSALIHPDDRVDLWRKTEETLAKRETFAHEYRIICPDGMVRWVANQSHVGLDSAGQVERITGVAMDITERKEAEAKLRYSEARYRSIFEGSALPVWEEDFSLVAERFEKLRSEGVSDFRAYFKSKPEEVRYLAGLVKIVDVSPASLEVLSVGSKEELLKKLPAYFQEESWEPFCEEMIALAEGKTRFFTEIPIVDSQGRRRVLSLHLAVIPGFESSLGRVMVSFLDITEKMRVSEELQTATTRALEANEAKDRFLAALSHELRTPLAPILAATHLLERRTDLPPSILEFVSIIKRNVNLEARLIDDLLDLNRIAHGKLCLSLSEVDVHEVIRQAVETCKVQLVEREHELELKLEAKASLVSGDWSRLQQIIWNLLSNAIKFTAPRGRISITTADNASGYLEIRVSDNGKGIDPQDLSRLFGAFEQGKDSTARNFGGLGLGLAISRGLTEMHNDKIHAVSDGKERGATFIVNLPVKERAVPSSPGAPLQQNVSRPGRAQRILLVEDNEDTGRLLKMVLDDSGHTVCLVGDVSSALQAGEREHFDLLLCDIGLPDGSGFDVVSKLRRQGTVDKAIAMTGFGMAEDIERSKKAGFETHLTKPVDIEELERLINEFESNH